MHTNLYLIEELARQRRQGFLEATAQDRLRAQLPGTRWQVPIHAVEPVPACGNKADTTNQTFHF